MIADFSIAGVSVSRRAIGVKDRAERLPVQMRPVKVFCDCLVNGVTAGDILPVRGAPCFQFAGFTRISRRAPVGRRVSMGAGTLYFVQNFIELAVRIHVVFATARRQAQDRGIPAAVHPEGVAVVFVRDFAAAMPIAIPAQGIPIRQQFVKK